MLRFAMVLGGFLSFSQAANAEEYALTLDVTTCLERTVPARFLGVSLRPARTIKLDEPYYFVYGSLGWHLTWGVLFDESTNPPRAYETYGSKGDITGAFGRMRVPRMISIALENCGYEWLWLWEHDWPDAEEKRLRAEANSHKSLAEQPLRDLMPPFIKTPVFEAD